MNARENLAEYVLFLSSCTGMPGLEELGLLNQLMDDFREEVRREAAEEILAYAEADEAYRPKWARGVRDAANLLITEKES